MQRIIGLITLLFFNSIVIAQPGNDNWKDAYEIEIGNNGYGSGTFIGKTTSFKNASTENREEFMRALKLVALNKKSVWY
ncbi:MAG: hypothetical protein ACPGLV_02300, partial [Bacteroidia bacterium]